MTTLQQLAAISQLMTDISRTVCFQTIQAGQLVLGAPNISAQAWKDLYLKDDGGKSFVDDPNEKVKFNSLIDWITIQLSQIQAGTFDPTTIRQVTCNGTLPRPTGQISAAVQHLLLAGAGVKPTIPAPNTLTPCDLGFILTSDIIEGQMAFNSTDNVWYYRIGNSIYRLPAKLRKQITSIDQDGNYNYTWNHGADDTNKDSVVTFFDKDGNSQPVTYQHVTKDQTIIYIGIPIVGTCKLKLTCED